MTLTVHTPTADVRGVALVLHGGRSKSHAPDPSMAARRPAHAPVREQPARRGRAASPWRGCATASAAGTDAERSPVPDAAAALDELADRFPGVPIALVGHSMGGRAALYTAGHEAVRVVVGLAPWIEPGDLEQTVDGLAGRRLLIAHGDLDRMTDPRASAAYARRAAGTAASASYVTVSADKHAMLGRAGVWHRLATGFVTGALWDASPVGTTAAASTKDSASTELDDALAQALAGTAAVVV